METERRKAEKLGDKKKMDGLEQTKLQMKTGWVICLIEIEYTR